MKLQSSKKETLDLLGADLLKATALRDYEVERIAGGSDLFANVRARIIVDSVVRNSASTGFAFKHKLVIASAAAAVMVVSMLAAMFTSDRRAPIAANKTPVVSPIPDQVVQPRPVQQVEISADDPDKPFVEIPRARSSRPQYVKTVEYRTIPEPRRASPRRETEFQETPGEFYALADLHPSEEAVRNGRIVRVDLPRASLVALGVNLPLDSDKQMIKTDLLVGPDGVPRAIRLVE
jgi:hypothetical protein